MGLFRCGCGLLRSVYHGSSGGLAWWAVGIFWHGGLAWWDVFLGIFDVDRCIRGQIGVFLGVFLGIFGVSWVFLGIFWVDRYIFLVFSMAWVSNRRRIGGVGGESGGRCWLQLVCVWLGVCGRC